MLIKVNGLSFGYEHKAILSNLSLSIERGDFVGIVGSNGAGKSSLVKVLTSQLKPFKGEIIKENNLRCGYLAQHNLNYENFPASVFEVVQSGLISKLKHRFFYSRKDKEKCLKIISYLALEPLMHKCYRELSGGQQRTVLLARSLCAADDLLILDEPNAGLDFKASEHLNKLIKKINQDLKLTIIMVTHDLNSLKNCNKVLYLDKGQNFFGSFHEYKASPFYKSLWGNV